MCSWTLSPVQLILQKQQRFFVDNLMLGVQLIDISTRCSSHPQGKRCTLSTTPSIKLSTKNLRSFYIATATESDVT